MGAQSKHTPTPWESEGRLIGGADRVRVADCHVGERPTEVNAANTAYIVRAVNAHERAMELIADLADFAEAQLRTPAGRRAARPMIDAARALLAELGEK